MMEQLRTLNLNRLDIDDAIGLLAFAKQAKAIYDEMGLEAPEWFTEKIEALADYVKERRKENLTKAVKEIEAEMVKLRTAEEKRAALKERLEKVRADLAK